MPGHENVNDLPPCYDNIAQVIGRTPMLDCHEVVRSRGLSGRLLAKLEYLNPGGSKKDRIAREMIVEARKDGRLKEGQPVVELTSGNTGTGLAMVCRATGHPFVAVMSRGNSIERAHMMRALGARVELVDQAPGSVPNQVSGADLDRVEQRTRQLVAELGAFRCDQFREPGNALAHERHTGPEVWRQSGGAVDVFVDFIGTAGSFTGVARSLKEKKPSLRAYVVEPATASVLAGQEVTNPSHKVQGGGYARRALPLFDEHLADGYVPVTDEAARDAAHLLAREQGVFGGYSAGANLAAAIELLEGPESGACVVFTVCDSGLKYLSTDLYQPA